MLKAQNSAAQAAIQGALNGPDHPPKGTFRNTPVLHQCNSHLFYLLMGEQLPLLSDTAFCDEEYGTNAVGIQTLIIFKLTMKI